ncbi:hypothetical protein COEREDRAFT_79999 [Coemansia reversa NRRL 1564]|uniref:Carbohydrate-binding domain-containing protein n=1 Tax=Coemansia reversa (strain ATCC 12441 / NRRL 1564) TaxID=763665 RepID=A0A2G5BGB5_COERN|nr:hypothetical protein COEREDRAFT_79999 [Coemansia reversa NRRL 1564]|eukprot:PIA18055.1 hypothetical protein COEREDRAFT_79999 [Coemansia reversa NRRL 1564]
MALASKYKADIRVPECPARTLFTFNTGIPESDPNCPLTLVSMCYTSTQLQLDFTAYNETNFYFDPKQETNEDIWEYEVVEAFIYKGTDDPQTYFEYEVNPNNVTYNSFVYNPSRTRADGAPFDHALIADPFADGFGVDTKLDKQNHTWKSTNTIPLALFNGENPKGSTWRMNFFRTVTSPKTYPDQQLCGWKNTNAANFHITSAFGTVSFV